MKPELPDFENCWQKVTQRDASGDGLFVYGVFSTRIFCRPSCPSKKPKRDGVQFFDSPANAVAAGFRACKRCLPEQDSDATKQRVQQACIWIEAHLDQNISLADLSRNLQISPSHLQRSFKKILGLSPREYSDALRLKQWKTQSQNGAPIMNATFDAGFGSSRALYERAPSQLGMTPATYRKGGAGLEIRFDIAPCNLGFLLVAKTQNGLCAVTLGDESEPLEANLRCEFSAAKIERDAASLRENIGAVLQLLEGKNSISQFPLDVRATAFQWRVWQELQKIERGQTRSYSQIAAEIGQPTAARAVARACATNSIALIIPCHRVVRGSGELSGYRWGLERKAELLKREREVNK